MGRTDIDKQLTITDYGTEYSYEQFDVWVYADRPRLRAPGGIVVEVTGTQEQLPWLIADTVSVSVRTGNPHDEHDERSFEGIVHINQQQSVGRSGEFVVQVASSGAILNYHHTNT